VAGFKYIIMETALERLLDYVGRNYNDEELDNLIEDINGICGTIERINNRINIIEQELTTFGSISSELEVELIRLKSKLIENITIL
jgi:hypothetical protein